MSGVTAMSPRMTSREWFRTFVQGREGSAAVEFAMVSIPFLTMLFSLIELGIVFMISMTLDDATMTAARQIRTGQTQTAGGAADTQSGFQAAICGNMTWIAATCASNLSVDVETFPSFAAATPTNPVTSGVFNPASLQFTPGAAQDVVVVRAYFRWKLITPFLDQALEKLSDGEAIIISTSAFRNEPYT
jgi:Flp pilus assembly protein TadG